MKVDNMIISKTQFITDCVFFFLLQSHSNICIIILLSYLTRADMAELADALDLGSSVFDVRVQVPLSAVSFKVFHASAWRTFFVCRIITSKYYSSTLRMHDFIYIITI